MTEPEKTTTTEIKRMSSSITTARIETLADGVFAILVPVIYVLPNQVDRLFRRG